MTKFSKLGATALAMALSLTMVAPISANAQVYSGGEQVYDIDRTGSATIDADDNVKYTYKSTTYKNRITGATADSTSKDEAAIYAAQHYTKEITKWTIGTDEYHDFVIEPALGEKIEKLKVKKGKDVVNVKKIGSSEEEIYPWYDYETKQAYFTKEDKTKDVVGTYDSYEAYQKAKESLKRIQYSETYRIFGKKPGTAKLQYKVGGSKKKLTITVSDDARAIQSVTYAGKRLFWDEDRKAGNDTVWYSQTNNKQGINYVTKKSGKLSVKLGKNYKFVKAFYVKGTPYSTKDDSYDHSELGYVDKQTGSHIRRTPTTGIDLNGDGDTLDTIYGIDERGFKANTVTFVKNNKKIKLDKTPDQSKATLTEEWGATGRTYKTTSKSEYKGNMATTTLYIVYKDKKTKVFGVKKFDISYRTSSK